MSKILYGLPDQVIYCKKCVISNQRPSSTIEFRHLKEEKKRTILFDSDGVCEACRYHEIKERQINWDAREAELVALCDRYRRKNGYDVVVPGSGGKDSAYTSHILKYKYGMNPLTVTWAPHLYTEIGWKNFQNWSHVGGLDNLLFTPNGRLHRYLTRLGFLNLLHPFQPFIVGQRIIGPKIASKFGINLVMYGENQAEYGNRIEENRNPTMAKDFFASPSASDTILGGVKIEDVINHGDFSFNDFEPYLPNTYESVSNGDISVHYLGYYLKWDPQECFYYATENTGFEPNSERTQGSYSKYSSIDDQIDPFHYFTTLIKFGIGRATYDAAQEVRNGKITRAEAISLVKQFDDEFPTKYFANFLEYIDISEQQFWQTIDQGRSPHLWESSAEGWKLRNPIWKSDG
jgi:N-acetyl sugar amidotransferase